MQRQVKYVAPVPVSEADGLVARVYAQVADEMRMVVPPAMLHSPAPDLLAAYWMLMRESLMPTGHVDRATKEAVATAVAVANICPYCVDMHSVGMYDLSGEHDADALVADRPADIENPRIREVALWARVAHERDAEVVRHPPFTVAERPEIVGVAVSLHYLTRMVNVFLSHFLLPPGLSPRARSRLKRGIGRLLSGTLRKTYAPGRSVPLLPAAALPPSAGWAAGNPGVASATARAFAAFDAAGRRVLSPAVRSLVCQSVAAWRGEDTGLDRDWVEALVADLPVADQAAARLALLTAMASYQVEADVVADFRRWHPTDVQLVEATAWASFVAARQIGAWQIGAWQTGPATVRSGQRCDRTPP